MKLELYLRTEFSYYIHDLFIKDKCEACRETENLNLHHDTQFDELLRQTLKELNLEYKDTKEYTSIELSNISNVMIGKQIKCKYHTLCENCHKKWHNGNQALQYYIIQKEKDELKKQEQINNLIPYLETLTGKRLYKDEQFKLKENFRTYHIDKRTIGINSINNFLKENNMLYRIKSSIDHNRRTIDGLKNNKYKKTYWTVIKIKE